MVEDLSETEVNAEHQTSPEAGDQHPREPRGKNHSDEVTMRLFYSVCKMTEHTKQHYRVGERDRQCDITMVSYTGYVAVIESRFSNII